MRLIIKVKPGSKKPHIEANDDGTLTVRVREPAAEGRANAGVTTALAEYFRVKKSQVTITHGHTSKTKIVEIE